MTFLICSILYYVITRYFVIQRLVRVYNLLKNTDASDVNTVSANNHLLAHFTPFVIIMCTPLIGEIVLFYVYFFIL